MLKLFLSLTIFLSYSFGITKSKIIQLYQNKEYSQLCKKTEWTFAKFKKDETILSIISLSCIKADKLNSAIRASRFMKNTKDGRANAAYVANLYLIKRLLIQFIFDKSNLSGLSLPKSNHCLSIVFDNISNNNFIKQGKKYIITSKNNIIYTLEPLKASNNKGIGVLITVINNNHKYKHLFW